MEILKKRLSDVSGGKVLDVATGGGTFIHFLDESFRDYSEITGIDNAAEEKLEKARQSFEGKNVRIIRMDGENLEFEDESFDTVCISNSLHHLANIDRVLQEMKRVLKPGGLFIISEMYRDNQTESQLSHVYMHHWWGEIDTMLGVCHNETFTREELIKIAESQGLKDIELYDWAELEDDPMDPETIKEMKKSVDTYLKKAENLPELDRLRARGEELANRLDRVGISGATELLIIGRK